MIRSYCVGTLCIFWMLALLIVPALASDEKESVPPQLKGSGLPVPRFVSTKNEANLRTGPGSEYPTEWIITKKGIPLEVTAEFDTWRRVRDWEGAEGWIHQSLLSGKRSAVITGKVRVLRKKPSIGAKTIANLEPGLVVNLEKCIDIWCKVSIRGVSGWLLRSEFWGVYPKERVE